LIAQKEDRLAEVSVALTDGQNYQSEELSKALVAEYNELEKEIPLIYQKWEELSLLLENS